ncbi:MAG TPA: response regulator [Verrucomicrobiae bacterium]
MKSLIEEPELGAQTEAPPPKEKILLVDDDPAIRQLLMRLLVDENYYVLTAANGVEALIMAETMNFDLVVLDLNMPIKDGWQTFAELSAKNPSLRFIVITARPNQFLPAMTSGVGALLEKPLDFVKLFSTIRNLLEEPARLRQERSPGGPSIFRYVPPKTEAAAGKSNPTR